LLGSFLRIEGRAEVTPRAIGRLERTFDGGRIDIGVRKLVGELKRLTERQSDGAGQRKFCDCIVVARDAQVVLLGMKLNLSVARNNNAIAKLTLARDAQVVLLGMKLNLS